MNRKKTRKRDLLDLENVALNETDFTLSVGDLLGVAAPPHAVVEEAPPPVRTSSPHYSHVTLQRTSAGRGGKWVTRVLLKPAQSEAQLEDLAKNLRKALGSGAHVEGSSVVVQGDIPDRLELWFRKQGISKIIR